ncbi:MAG: T9SS type A sorting domain-containing protein, partial [Bacteroidota bacterium]
NLGKGEDFWSREDRAFEMSVLASSVANRDDQISFFLLVDMEHLTHRGLQAFYASQRNTVPEKLMRIDSEQKAFFVDLQLTEQGEIGLLLDSLNRLQVDYEINASENVILDIELLIERIDDWRDAYQNSYSQILKNSQRLLSKVTFDNSSIQTENTLAKNEQIVNNLFLDVLTESRQNLDESQKNLLFDVANQCPKHGGRYVYRARTLYNWLVEYKDFDDEMICEVIEERTEENKPIEQVTAAKSDMQMNLFPNPAQDVISIEIDSFKERQDLSIELYDFNGRRLKSQTLNSGQSTLETYSLSEGVYFISLFVNGVRLETQRIIILK